MLPDVRARSMPEADAMDEQTALMNDEPVVGGTASGPDPTASTDPSGGRTPWYRLPVFRDTSDTRLGGVVSGICQTYGFDRRTSRIALVLASLVLPVLVLVYVIAWILLPDTPAQAQPLADVVGDRRRFPLYVALGLVVVAGGLGSIGSWFVFGDFPWGVGLIALGVLLWATPSLRPGRRRDGLPPANPGPSGAAFPVPAGVSAPADGRTDAIVDPATNEPTTLMPGAALPTPARAGGGGGGSMGSGGTLLTPPAMPATPRRRRFPIGSITALAIAVGAAGAAAGDALGWWDVPVLGVVVTSTIAFAAGLVISAIVNRAWFFVPIVLVLGGAASFLVVAEPSLDGGVGERTSRPTTVADAEQNHDLAIGELTLDLVDVPLDRNVPLLVTAEIGIGRLHVIVPAGATLVVTSDVGTGHVMVGDREVLAGVRQDDRRTIAAVGEPTGTIELDLRVGIGEIDLDRDAFSVLSIGESIDGESLVDVGV